MKITQVLWRQHIGRMIKRHWWVQGQQILRDTPTEQILQSKGIEVVDAKEVATPPKIHGPKLDIFWSVPKPQPLDETHPDWNETPCLKYETNSLLLDGIEQAQLLTKSEGILDALPEKFQNLEENPSPNIEELIQRFIRSSHIFEAHQEKLPKVKDPLRIAFNLPRVYGIPDVRKTHNLIQKLLQLCELISDPTIVQQRKIIHNGHVRTYIEKESDLLYLESSIDTMITSNKILTPMCPDKTFGTPLPNIYPLLPTIGLEPENIYNLRDHYPVACGSPWTNPHTIFINYDSQLVKNKTELPVRETQILARSLLKSFATAACYAKQKFREGTLDLTEPISVQCVQSDGKWFHFSVFQLNTLNVSGNEGTRNVWWSMPRINLYEKAEYVCGVPTLEGYNPEVFKKILAFYRNV